MRRLFAASSKKGAIHEPRKRIGAQTGKRRNAGAARLRRRQADVGELLNNTGGSDLRPAPVTADPRSAAA